MICGISIEKVIAEALRLDGHVELRAALPIHPISQYTWSARIPGRGVYMGRADEDVGEMYGTCITFDDPDTFVPEG